MPPGQHLPHHRYRDTRADRIDKHDRDTLVSKPTALHRRRVQQLVEPAPPSSSSRAGCLSPATRPVRALRADPSTGWARWSVEKAV